MGIQQMFKHILIATDGSELAETAIAAGLELAKALGARATAVTVSDSAHLPRIGCRSIRCVRKRGGTAGDEGSCFRWHAGEGTGR